MHFSQTWGVQDWLSGPLIVRGAASCLPLPPPLISGSHFPSHSCKTAHTAPSLSYAFQTGREKRTIRWRSSQISSASAGPAHYTPDLNLQQKTLGLGCDWGAVFGWVVTRDAVFAGHPQGPQFSPQHRKEEQGRGVEELYSKDTDISD